jgi:orotate phosphoribosyltransferase
MDVEKLLKDSNVLLEGHFLLNSGLHSKYYFQKYRILENPVATTALCKRIVDAFKKMSIDWIVGPTTGGIVIAYEVARQMNLLTAIAEEVNGKRVIRRGYDIKGKSVLVVDDVMTTGKSLAETLDAVRAHDVHIAGTAVLIDRSTHQLPFEYFATYKKTVENFEPDSCPLCNENIPLSTLGGL